MGMFDYLSGLKVKCPVCGKKRDREWQVKGLLMQLDQYKVGDKTNNEIEDLTCVGNCPICSTLHFVDVEIKDGIITDNVIFMGIFAEWSKYHRKMDKKQNT